MTEPTGPVRWEMPSPVVGPAPGVEFAPHGQRLVAYILDSFIVSFVLLAFLGPMFVMIPTPEAASSIDVGGTVILGAFGLMGVVVTFLYFPFFWASWGRTPGMRVFGLYVVRDQDGSRFGWKTALLRLLGLYVASAVFYLGFIWIFVDKRRRGFQDLIAGTVVVKRT